MILQSIILITSGEFLLRGATEPISPGPHYHTYFTLHNLYNSSIRVIRPSLRLPYDTQHSTLTRNKNIHDLGRIRTRNPSKHVTLTARLWRWYSAWLRISFGTNQVEASPSFYWSIGRDLLFCMGVKLGRWHCRRKGSWGCLRTWCWGEYLDRGGTR